MRKLFLISLAILASSFSFAQAPDAQTKPAEPRFAEDVQKFITVDAPLFAITHVRVIDGTGVAPLEDQTIIVSDGKIQSIGKSSDVKVPANARGIDKTGYTVIPGLVGMHDHLYYTASLNRNERGGTPAPGFFVSEVPFTAPRLYLASGVTSMRTAGSVEPYTDMNVKNAIEAGRMPGPKIDVTAPYLEGPPGARAIAQLHELTGADDARDMVRFWSGQGFTSFKAYMNITRAELKTAAEEAHKRGLKITGHLCSVGYREAAELGIDNLEHSFFADTEFVPTKKPDVCPSQRDANEALTKLEPADEAFQKTVRTLIEHHVAITSTLPVFEPNTASRPPVPQRVLDAMSPESKISYLSARARAPQSIAGQQRADAYFKKHMQLEFAFAKAGGVLMAGPDPTGGGGVLPGFGDQREVELLVEEGFTPVEAIKIATYNGAQFMGALDHIGTLAQGKQADIVLINGDPSKNINDIEKIETVFKDGVGFDSAALYASVKGMVGIR